VDEESVADELYTVEPGEFVAARDTRVKEARKEGDRELAAAIAKMRRPTTGAWLANLLVRERPDAVGELLELGEAMRTAQSNLAGADLRELSQQRRRVVATLSDEARRLAAGRGHPVRDPGARELEETLEAALADAGAASALASGRLVTTLRFTGFGGVDLSGAVAVGPSAASRTPADAGRRARPATPAGPKTAKSRSARPDERGAAALAAAERTVAEARAELDTAEAAAEEGEHRRRDLAEAHARAREQVARLEQQVREARATEQQVAGELGTAKRQTGPEARAVQAARTKVAKAEAALGTARSSARS
jgi:hypothetical protein